MFKILKLQTLASSCENSIALVPVQSYSWPHQASLLLSPTYAKHLFPLDYTRYASTQTMYKVRWIVERNVLSLSRGVHDPRSSLSWYCYPRPVKADLGICHELLTFIHWILYLAYIAILELVFILFAFLDFLFDSLMQFSRSNLLPRYLTGRGWRYWYRVSEIGKHQLCSSRTGDSNLRQEWWLRTSLRPLFKVARPALRITWLCGRMFR